MSPLSRHSPTQPHESEITWGFESVRSVSIYSLLIVCVVPRCCSGNGRRQVKGRQETGPGSPTLAQLHTDLLILCLHLEDGGCWNSGKFLREHETTNHHIKLSHLPDSKAWPRGRQAASRSSLAIGKMSCLWIPRSNRLVKCLTNVVDDGPTLSQHSLIFSFAHCLDLVSFPSWKSQILMTKLNINNLNFHCNTATI